MSASENAAYKELMAAIEPADDGRVLPSWPYAELMRRESVADSLQINTQLPGVLRELDWVQAAVGGDVRRRAAYVEYMRLRQEAFAASDVNCEMIIAASAIDELTEVTGVGPGFLSRQLRRLRDSRRAVYIAPTSILRDHLGQHISRAVLMDSITGPGGVYEDFPFNADSKQPHERWYTPNSPHYAELVAAQLELRNQIVGSQDSFPRVPADAQRMV